METRLVHEHQWKRPNKGDYRSKLQYFILRTKVMYSRFLTLVLEEPTSYTQQGYRGLNTEARLGHEHPRGKNLTTMEMRF